MRKRIFTLIYSMFCISPLVLILQITTLVFIIANYDMIQWPKYQVLVKLELPTIGTVIHIISNKGSVEALVVYEVGQHLYKFYMDT